MKKNIFEIIDDFLGFLYNKVSDGIKFVQKIITDKDTNAIFKFFIKLFMMCVIFAVLRLPFYLVEYLGLKLLDFVYFPVSTYLSGFYETFILIAYVITCLYSLLRLIKINSTKGALRKFKDEYLILKKIILVIVLGLSIPIITYIMLLVILLMVLMFYAFGGTYFFSIMLIILGNIFIFSYVLICIFTLFLREAK